MAQEPTAEQIRRAAEYIRWLHDEWGVGYREGSLATWGIPVEAMTSLTSYSAALIGMGYDIPDEAMREVGVNPDDARGIAALATRLGSAAQTAPWANAVASALASRLVPIGSAAMTGAAGIGALTALAGSEQQHRNPMAVLFTATTVDEATGMAREAGVPDEEISEVKPPADPWQGQVVSPIMVWDAETMTPIGVGIAYGVGTTGDPVIVLPQTALSDMNDEEGPPVQGGERKVLWQRLSRGPMGDSVMPSWDPLFGETALSADGQTLMPVDPVGMAVTSRVVFGEGTAEATRETLLRILEDAGIRLHSDQVEAFGTLEDYVDPEATMDDDMAAAFEMQDLLYGDTATYYGRNKPARVLYDSNGQRIRLAGRFETDTPGTPRRVGVGGREGGLIGGGGTTISRIDPVTGVNLGGEGGILDIAPYFTDDFMAEEVLEGMSAEELRSWEVTAANYGLIPWAAVGGDALTEAHYTAMRTAMTYSNDHGIMDGITVRDPMEAIHLAMRGWSRDAWGKRGLISYRKPIDPYTPQATYLPSAAYLANTVEDEFERQTGRKPNSRELQALTDYMTARYRLQSQQAQDAAEREYLLRAQEDIRVDEEAAVGMTGGRTIRFLTADQLAKLSATAGEQRLYSPEDEFRRYFQEHYRGAIEFGEDQDSAVDLRNSILGSLATMRGLT